MRVGFIFLLLLACSWVNAQSEIEILTKRANNYFNSGKYDSALTMYLKSRALLSEENASFSFSIANCYIELGDTKRAEQALKDCLFAYEKDSFAFIQEWACKRLYNIYFKQERYQEALNYFDSSKTKYVPKRRMCRFGMGYFYRQETAIKRARCLIKLNEHHLALESLSEVVFFPDDYSLMMDTAFYEEAAQTFFDLSCQLYGKEAMTELVENSLKDLTHKVHFHNKDSLAVDVNAYITLMGKKIVLRAHGTSLDKKGSLRPEDQVEYIRNEVRSSLAYKLLALREY